MGFTISFEPDWGWVWQRYLERIKGMLPNVENIGGIDSAVLNNNLVKDLLAKYELEEELATIDENFRDQWAKTYAENMYWQCIARGVFYPSSQRDKVRVTPFGRHFLHTFEDHYYDKDSFVSSLLEQIPELDSEVRDFLSESYKAFENDCDNAAIVMLGCASEKLLYLMIEAYRDAEPESNAKFLKDKQAKMNYGFFREEFVKYFKAQKQELPDDLKGSFVDRIALPSGSIRIHRNNSGHPLLKKTSHIDMATHLYNFRNYCTACYDLIRHWS